MPYNMQLVLLKAEESEAFYRDKMYEKEKEIDDHKKQCRMLDKKCEEAYEIQHEMENALEEYEVNTKRWEEQLKSTNRKFQELQRKCSTLESENSKLESKVTKLEQDKCKLSEKWIKLSTKNKNDDKVRQRLKDLESVAEKKERELSSLTDKLNKNERENAMLRKANDSLQTTISQQVKKIKTLKSSRQENHNEQAITDEITNELLEKLDHYEALIEEMRIENQNLVQELEARVDQSDKIEEYENIIQELELQIQNIDSLKNEEFNKKIMEVKEESLIKESENLRLKEKNDNLNNQIQSFKQEFDSLQDYLSIKEDHIRNKFKDEEVWVCIQMLLKELISLDKKQSLNFLGINKNVKKEDLDEIIKSHYLTDSYVRFVIVNSVAYLQECKESLNYLKQKYAESELKYDNIITKYQSCKNEKTTLQSNSALLENNVNRLIQENQKLNEEKFYIMKTCMQNQSQVYTQGPSFVQSYDAANLQKALQNLRYEIIDKNLCSSKA